MGKSKKSKKGGGSKKGAKKEQLIAFREAILTYQLEVRQKSVKELEEEACALQELNERYKERNMKLKKEQVANFQAMLKKAKQQENEIEQNQIYNFTHVEEALKSKWNSAELEENLITTLIEKEKITGEKCLEMEEKVRVWSTWRDGGRIDNEVKLVEMQSQLEDMKQNFEEMRHNMEQTMKKTMASMAEQTDKEMAESTVWASENAMNQLDQETLEEIRENQWLRKEAQTHRVEERNLRREVEQLEQKNLQIISELLQCQIHDLKVSTNFCEDNLVENGESLEGDQVMNLENLSIYQTEHHSDDDSPAPEKSCICEPKPLHIKEEICGVGHSISVDFDGIESKVIANQQEDINLNEDQELMHLGPMEVRLLHVAGKSKPLHHNLSADDDTKKVKSRGVESRTKWTVGPSSFRDVLKR